jgi:hypothetical protein
MTDFLLLARNCTQSLAEGVDRPTKADHPLNGLMFPLSAPSGFDIRVKTSQNSMTGLRPTSAPVPTCMPALAFLFGGTLVGRDERTQVGFLL